MAAIEAGRVLWSQASSELTLGTAFACGELALTVGRELRIVDCDGQIRQTFSVPEPGIVTAPPAIAPDGSVWVATQKALYVAR